MGGVMGKKVLKAAAALFFLQIAVGANAEPPPDIAVLNQSDGIKKMNIAIGEKNVANTGSIKLKKIAGIVVNVSSGSSTNLAIGEGNKANLATVEASNGEVIVTNMAKDGTQVVVGEGNKANLSSVKMDSSNGTILNMSEGGRTLP